jgi:hypothetical protein
MDFLEKKRFFSQSSQSIMGTRTSTSNTVVSSQGKKNRAVFIVLLTLKSAFGSRADPVIYKNENIIFMCFKK